MMDILYKIFFVFLFASKFVFSNEVEELFKKGNEHYIKGEYEEAINSYESIVTKGYINAQLFYNLGNAYFRFGKLGKAILYYEKAKKISPSDEDINHNLSFANSRIIDNIETLPKFFIFEWWENLLSLFSITGWTFTAYFLYLLVLFSIGVYFFARSFKIQKLALYSGLISALTFILVVILLIVNLNRELNVKYAVIIDQQVVTKFSPDVKSGDAFVVHEGLKVKAEDSINDWVKIKLIDGKVGWLKKESLEII